MNLDSWQLLWGMVVDTFALMGQCFMECPLQLFKQTAGFITCHLSQGTPLPLTQGTTQSKWGLNLIHSFPHLQGRMWYILAFFLNIPAQENCRDDWLTKTQNPQPPPPHFHETNKKIVQLRVLTKSHFPMQNCYLKEFQTILKKPNTIYMLLKHLSAFYGCSQ